MNNSTTTHNNNGKYPSPEQQIAKVAPHINNQANPQPLTTDIQGTAKNATPDRPLPFVRTAPVDDRRWEHLREVLRGMRADVVPPSGSVPTRVTNSWDGVVVALSGDTFEGEFVPRSSSAPRLRASFSTDLIDPDDLELLKTGALFELTVGKARIYKHRWNSTMRIRIRRLPPVSQEEVAAARSAAQLLRQQLQAT
jgi:hypothetical protein